jgi:hypothetical protein
VSAILRDSDYDEHGECWQQHIGECGKHGSAFSTASASVPVERKWPRPWWHRG